MGVTPETLQQLGIVDEIIPEPLGGAHRDLIRMIETLRPRLAMQLDRLCAVPLNELLDRRYQRLMSYGNPDAAVAMQMPVAGLRAI